MTTTTNNTDTNIKETELLIPIQYLESSQRLKWILQDIDESEEQAKHEILYMLKTLESYGYSRTRAIEQIENDHKHLKGFSRRTIYRVLPDEIKNKYISGAKQFNNTENVSNDTINNLQEKDEHIVNITTSYDIKDVDTTTAEETVVEPSIIVDLPSPEPELQDPKIINFVGQLPKPVLRLAEKIQLSSTKLELLAKYSRTSTILRDHHQIQKNLVEAIASLTIDKAKIVISQKIRDLETGALVRTGQDSYTLAYDKREKIPKKPDTPKHPVLYFLELMDKIDEVLYIGTGYKITRDDDVSSYEPNHIAATQKHRFAMLNEMDGRQINMLQDKIEVLRDLLNAFDYEIDEVWKNKE